MAITTLVARSNRLGPRNFLYATVSGVAVDAQVGELFRLPVGYGQMHLEAVMCTIDTLSGAYVAVAPAFDGVELAILSPDGTTRVDIIGAERFVVRGTASARPAFAVTFDFNNKVLMRQDELIFVSAPAIAGAGVTAVVGCFIRGVRFSTG